MKKSGQYAKVTIDVDGVPQQVMELRDWSVSASSEKIDASVAGSAWAEHVIGRKSWEGEATCVSADQFWLEIMSSHVTISFYDDGSDSAPVFEGQASIDFERTAPHDDLIETTLTFTGNGPLTSN